MATSKAHHGAEAGKMRHKFTAKVLKTYATLMFELLFIVVVVVIETLLRPLVISLEEWGTPMKNFLSALSIIFGALAFLSYLTLKVYSKQMFKNAAPLQGEEVVILEGMGYDCWASGFDRICRLLLSGATRRCLSPFEQIALFVANRDSRLPYPPSFWSRFSIWCVLMALMPLMYFPDLSRDQYSTMRSVVDTPLGFLIWVGIPLFTILGYFMISYREYFSTVHEFQKYIYADQRRTEEPLARDNRLTLDEFNYALNVNFTVCGYKVAPFPRSKLSVVPPVLLALTGVYINNFFDVFVDSDKVTDSGSFWDGSYFISFDFAFHAALYAIVSSLTRISSSWVAFVSAKAYKLLAHSEVIKLLATQMGYILSDIFVTGRIFNPLLQGRDIAVYCLIRFGCVFLLYQMEHELSVLEGEIARLGPKPKEEKADERLPADQRIAEDDRQKAEKENPDLTTRCVALINVVFGCCGLCFDGDDENSRKHEDTTVSRPTVGSKRLFSLKQRGRPPIL